MKKIFTIILSLFAFGGFSQGDSLPTFEESLPPLKEGRAPQDLETLWKGYDPRAEPLEIEVLKEWEEDGVILRIVRFRIGIFKGKKAMMAGVYGFPKGGAKLPGLVQIHGGGQFADYKAPLFNAKRGYATLSIAWAGRISAPGYSVNPDGVKLFWENKTEDPNYRLTTDWGALDAYHAPCRNAKNEFANVRPAEWTLDSVDSPRNSPWFLCTLGARRALTFLEQQPEVDGQKLGVYGHSMGGKISVMTAGTDDRVKAVAPSCGGVSNRNTGNELYDATLSDNQSLKRIRCPIIFLSPSNDFHGRIDDLQTALGEIPSPDWRVSCSPHHNHQDTAEYEVAGPLWFDQFLKGTFDFPLTPQANLVLDTKERVPLFSVVPDQPQRALSVDVYYTQQGQMAGEKNDDQNTRSRFWHHVAAKRDGDKWIAELPLLSIEKPLWVFANILYSLEQPVSGAGYYYRVYTVPAVNISSRMSIATPSQLAAAGVKATLQPSLLIEAFDKGWQKEWFTYDAPSEWPRKTHKIYDPQFQAPAGARLAMEVKAENANKLVVGIDDYASEVALKGGPEWQSVVLAAADFQNGDQKPMENWDAIRELRLGSKEVLRSKADDKGGKVENALQVGGKWNGSAPEFRNLKWLPQ